MNIQALTPLEAFNPWKYFLVVKEEAKEDSQIKYLWLTILLSIASYMLIMLYVHDKSIMVVLSDTASLVIL